MNASQVFLIAFFTSAITATGTVFVVHKLDLAPDNREVEVPRLFGLTEQNARMNLESRGLSMMINERRSVKDAKPGTVVRQLPLPGEPIARGQVVTVALAKAPSAVPNMKGRAVAEATLMLEQEGFKLVVGEPVPHDSVPAGKIATQVPEAGTSYEAGRTITVNPSAGPGAVRVPKVVGKSLRKAKRLITEAGFEVGEIKWTYDDDRGPFVVLEQNPVKQAKPGSSINLVVNQD